MEFEWDARKATKTLRKHKVSLGEAARVFADPPGITVPDPDHSIQERRYLTIGMSNQLRPLIVAHTERGNRIRIITARPLTSAEREAYEEEIQS